MANLEVSVDELLKAVERYCEDIYETTEIFLGNPLYLIKIDMSEIPCNCFFVSRWDIAEGKLYKVEDSELKKELLEFIAKYPDRLFRGKKYN